MSEFKIKVSVELDSSDLESKLNALGKDQKIKIDIDSSGLDKIENQLKGLKKSFQDAFKIDSKTLSDLNKLTNAQEKLTKQQNKQSLANQKGEMKNLVNEYKDFANLYSKLQKQMNSGKLGEESIKRTAMQMSELKTNMSQLYDKMNSNAKQQIDLFNTKQMNKGIADMNSAMNKIESQATSLGTKLNSISFDHIDTSKIENIQAELKQIQDIAKQDIELDFNVGDILSDLNRLSSEIKNLEKVENLASSFDKISGSIKDAGGDVENFANSIKELENSADKIDGSFEKAFKGVNSELKDMQSTVKKISSDTNGKGLFGSILGSKEDFLGNFAQFTLAEIAGDFISDGIRTIARGWKDTVVETDAAMTDLRKVYDKNLTGNALKGYLNSVAEVAKGTGKSSVDVIQGTAKAVQSGISDIDKALTFAKQSAIFSNVGDVDQGTADTVLASVMSAYGGVENSLKPVREQIKGASKDYNTLTKFMDLANYAGNNFAISTADVGEALQQSAAALKTNGVSMEQSVGMITAMNEITQNAGKTGNALKTISSNMAGVTVSAKDGTLQTNKTAKALKEIAGIDVWNKQTGEIKDMYTVMDELNGKWGDLTEAQQNALGVSIAGRTQLNTFNALMSNWKTAQQYVKDYKDGLMVGSAERENAQYLDSIAGKWNVIKENMKAAGNTIITSDMAKGFLDVGVVLSEGFNKGIQGLSKGVSSVLKGNVFTDIESSISDKLYRIFEKIDLGKGINGFTAKVNDFFGTSLGKIAQINPIGKLASTLFENIPGIDDFGNKFVTSLSNSIGKAFSFAFSKTSMGKFLKPITDMLNVDGLFEGKKLDNQIDSRNENINAIKSEINGLKNQKQAIEDILPTYDKLTQKTKLTASESQQLAEIKNQLADSNPDLVLGYDQNGTPILKNLQLQNKQLESQIKLKQQSQRLEENSLALDTLQRQTLGQKEFNKAYKEYNDMQLASDTKRKKGLFGEESTQDYAKRIIDDNKKIAEVNQKAYEQRLKDHQQYVQDEKAIQQKYMNEMTQKASFNRLSDEMKSGMLTFMDALDWSQFSPAEGNQFAGMLANLGDKLVPTTEAMGKQSKAIAQLTQDYANGKTNLINYTKGLTEQYEAAGKFDTESFSAWRQGLQSYVDTTGDLQGANKAINEMATSLNKITGIKTDTWKTALSFDPAPIDASNKALQKFLNSYGTGVQNLGKGGMADKLTSQFETLQNSYTQMTSDLASGKEIDVEYLVNAKVNQPKPIASLIDEIVSDNKVTEQEIDLLLTAQAEILNTGEISDETIKQIADEFDMTETEVKAMLKIDAEVTGMEDLASKIEGWDELTNEEKELVLTMTSEGEGEFKMSVEEWNQLTPEEKEEKLKLMAEGKEEITEAKNALEELPDEKNTNVNINAGDTSGIDKGKEVEELPDNKRILVDASAGDTTGIEKGKEVEELPDDKNVIVNTPTGDITGLEKAKETETLPDNKNIMVNTPMGDVTGLTKGKEVETLPSDKSIVVNTPTGDISGIEKGKEVETLPDNKQITVNASTGDTSGIEKAKEVDKLPKEKEIKVSIVQKAGNVLDSISNFFKSKTEEKVSVSVQVTGKEQVESVKNAISSMQNKNISVNVNGNALSQVNQIKSALNGLQIKNISINANGNALSQINSIKSALSGIQNKNISINASGNALSQINSIKSALSGLQSKSISVNASVNGVAQVNTLKASIASLQGKSVSVSCSTSGTAQVNALTSAIGRVQGKSVSVTANVNGTGAVNALISAINRVKSKSVKISASVSGTGAVQGLASAIAGVRSKSVSVRVTKTVTTVQKSAVASSTPINATPMLMNTPLADIPVSASDESSIDVPVSISAKNNNSNGTINTNKILSLLDSDISNVKNLEEALKRVGNAIDLLNKKAEVAFGKEKISLLQQQIPLLQKQQKIQEEILEKERSQNNAVYDWLNNKGFKFSANGDIDNYEDRLLSMSKNVEALKKKYDDLNDAKKKNESATKSAQTAYENANEELTKTKKYLEEYFATNNSEISEAQKKWYEYKKAIKDTQDQIEELQRTMALEPFNNSVQESEYLLDRVNDRINLLDESSKFAEGQEAINYMNQKIDLYNEKLQVTREEYQRLHALAGQYQNYIWKFGFTLDENSLINNYDEVLNSMVGTKNYETAKKYADEYMNLVRGDLIDIQLEALKTENAIKEVQQSIEEAKKKAEEERRNNVLESIQNKLQEVEYALDRCKDKIDLLDAGHARSQGATKLKYLNERVRLLNKQLATTQNQIKAIGQAKARYQNLLWEFGFRIDENGLIDNYDSILQTLIGRDDYDQAKKIADEYMKLVRGDLIDAQEDVYNLNNEIKDIQDEIEKLNRELKLFSGNLDLTILNQQFDKLSNRLEIINNELEYAYGADKLNLMNESIKLMNQQLATQADIINKTRKQMSVYREDLEKYGFKFDSAGNIENYKEMMEHYRDTEDIEKLTDLTKEYFDLQADKLPDLIGKYSDLEKEIKDAYKDQLEITQDMEEEVTKIIEKEYERRKDEIEKYTDERIKLLEKEKKAYQEMRDEQDYEKSINEQTKEIADLQKKLETARKDNSIAGLKRQSEILKEIEEAQKKLEETTQERIDSEYESNIDDEIDKLKEEQENLIASLDDKFSETNIAKMVAQAISSGFIEINGEVKTLQDALIQSINDSAEGYSVMADIIKNELVANLNVALNTMQQIADINEKLGLKGFDVVSATQVAPTNIPVYTSGDSKTITIGDTIINVSGSVDDVTLSKIEDMIKEENERMLKEITNGI